MALGLARALSRDRHRRVLLLELDLRRPALDDELGLDPPAAGPAPVPRGQGATSRCCAAPGRRASGFSRRAAGPPRASPARLAARLPTLLRAADRVFDYVVADCPPLLEGDDDLALPDHLDGFVFVVRSRRAPRETIQRAAALLKPELIVGLVLNAQHDILRRRR